MNAKERAITAEDREKHASKIARAVVETIGILPHDAYINLANYVVAREREAQCEAIEKCVKYIETEWMDEEEMIIAVDGKDFLDDVRNALLEKDYSRVE